MNDELNKVEVGRRIRAAREELNLSREQFAERVPMSPSYLQDVEGGTKCLSLEKFFRVMHVLNVSADYLLSTEGRLGSEEAERVILLERIREDTAKVDVAVLRDIASIVRTVAHAMRRDSKG